MNLNRFNEIINNHEKWRMGEGGGRAVFTGETIDLTQLENILAIKKVKFLGCDFIGKADCDKELYFSKCDFKDCDFTKITNAKRIVFSQCDLRMSSFKNMDIKHRFIKCDLRKVDFRGTYIHEAIFYFCKMDFYPIQFKSGIYDVSVVNWDNVAVGCRMMSLEAWRENWKKVCGSVSDRTKWAETQGLDILTMLEYLKSRKENVNE